MFAVYHIDRKGQRVLIQLVETNDQAQKLILEQYNGRFRDDRDRVIVADGTGQEVYSVGVDYMPQLVAKEKWTVPSNSGRGNYTVQLNKIGILSCGCKGWTFKRKGKPRSCAHCDTVIRAQGLDTYVDGDYIFVRDAKLEKAKKFVVGAKANTPQAMFAALVTQYEAAISKLAKLEIAEMIEAAQEVEIMKFKIDSMMLLFEQKGINGAELYQKASGTNQGAMS